MDYLRSTKKHPTAEHVYTGLRESFPKLSLGTVYRNLNVLTECGEIVKLDCGDGVDHFDATVSPHYHFICSKCGSVMDMDMPLMETFDKRAAECFDGEIQGHRVYFYGRCKDCL